MPALAAVLLSVTTLLGCSSTTFKTNTDVALQILPRAIGNSHTTCAGSIADSCAILSPLLEKAHEISKKTSSSPPKHYVTLLDIGDEALQARVHLIRAAQKSINIQTFIWGSDESAKLIFDELLKAAQRGVQVRIIADQMNSGSDPGNVASAAVAHQNLKIKLYNPTQGKAITSRTDLVTDVLFDFKKLNHRMHNKVMIFDGLVGLAGGRNIEDKYFDRDDKFNFIDRDVLVIGPATTTMQVSFEEFWSTPISQSVDQLKDTRAVIFDGDKQRTLPPVPRPNDENFKELSDKANDYQHIDQLFLQTAYLVDDVLFSADRPLKPFVENESSDERIRGEFKKIIRGAKQSILVQTPYFVLSDNAYSELRQLRKSNPDIEFSISTNSLATADHYYVYALGFKHKKRNLKKLRFNIFELKNTPVDAGTFIPSTPVNKQAAISIHAKSLVIDNQYAVIGSHNFDPRSGSLNTESVLIIKDAEFASALNRRIRLATQAENSWIIARRQKVPVLGHISGIFASVSRALPLFDLWPFRYTSSYELKEGKKPVPREHPDFYSNYRNVGQFPGTGLGDKQVRSLLVSGFGAVLEPLM